MVCLQRGQQKASTADKRADGDRLHERDTQVHQFAGEIPALREPARNLRRHQRLPR